MIRSMTGYGAAKGMAAGLSVTVELKSVNNRYLDVSVKLPRGLLSAEDALKAAVGRHTTRGKVDMFVTVDAAESDDQYAGVSQSFDAVASQQQFRALHPFFHRPNRFR